MAHTHAIPENWLAVQQQWRRIVEDELHQSTAHTLFALCESGVPADEPIRFLPGDGEG
jgi:hypothetical protein